MFMGIVSPPPQRLLVYLLFIFLFLVYTCYFTSVIFYFSCSTLIYFVYNMFMNIVSPHNVYLFIVYCLI